MPPSDRFASSIPIPDELVEWFAREMAGKCDGISVFDDECSMPANDAVKALYRHDARDYLEEMAPKFYEAWAEALVEDQAAVEAGQRELDAYLPLSGGATFAQEAAVEGVLRAALGLGDRSS
jgi:hypothetical protein